MSTPSLPPGSYLLLRYDYVPDVLERRDPFRQAHLEHAAAARSRGELVAIGATAEPGGPPSGAVLVFRGVDPQVLLDYAAADPYTVAGLVTGRLVQAWTVL